MLALVSYHPPNQPKPNPKAKRIGSELRLVANDLHKSRERNTKRDFESSVEWERRQRLEAQRRLASYLSKAMDVLEAALNIGASITRGEYRTFMAKLKVAKVIFKIHGLL